MSNTQITFYATKTDDEVEPIAHGQNMTECSQTLIPDYFVENGRIRCIREIATDDWNADKLLVTLDEGMLDIRNGWVFFTPIVPIPTATDVYDNRD